MKKETIVHLLNRTLFVLLSSAVMVFFSEKIFWYVQGFAIWELILYYAIPVAISLWVIDLFQVQRLSGVVLVGAMYGFMVEGVLTPVIYEAGLLDPVMPAYFIGWHGLLSLVVGWYLIRKYLVSGQWKKLLLISAAIGLFWGLWSLPYRLPESIQEFEILVQQGESFLPGAWPVLDYAFYTLVFSGMVMTAHWLLGRGVWQKEFSLKKWGKITLLVILAFLFAFQVFPVVPLGILKLLVLVALVLIPLHIQKQKKQGSALLEILDGKIRFSETFPLLVIPLIASLVYGLAAALPPPDDLIRLMYMLIYTIQMLIGGGFFVWAWVDSFRRS